MSASVARPRGLLVRRWIGQIGNSYRPPHGIRHRLNIENCRSRVAQRLLEPLELLGDVRLRLTSIRHFSRIAQNRFSQTTLCSSDRCRVEHWRT